MNVTSLQPAQDTSQTDHIFTVDVEEYFQVHAFERCVSRFEWCKYPSRLMHGTDALLEVLARDNTKATFFVLGWIAHNYPETVKKIASAGHEIASHGWWHQRITKLTHTTFRQDVRNAKMSLEDIVGAPVNGFRAPGFSLTPGHEWAFDVLIEESYKYDSSLFPIKRVEYGYPDAPPVPHIITRASGTLIEFPPATTVWRGIRLPAAGGGYLRHLPYSIIRRAFLEHDAAGLPGVFYIHPWELDPDQPRLKGPWVSQVRHYRGLRKTRKRLEQLLSEFRFTSIANRLLERETCA